MTYRFESKLTTIMRNTKRRPVTVGQMLVTEFLEPLNIEINELAEAIVRVLRVLHHPAVVAIPYVKSQLCNCVII